MKFNSPSLPELHAFLAVCQQGSFSRAAQTLFVTQAAVSRSVRRLEEHLNCQLLMRTPTGVFPTEKGSTFQSLIETHVAGLENATALFTRSNAIATPKTKHKLRLSVIPTLGTRWLMPLLPQFQAAYPELSIELRQFRYDEDFARDDVDIWIDVNRTKAWPRDYKHIHLMSIEMAPICTPTIASRLERAEDLFNEILLHHTNFPNNWAVWMRGAGIPKAEPVLGPGFDLGNNLIVAAASGMGVGVIHPILAARELASGELVMPFQIMVPTGRGYYVCYRNEQAENSAIRIFVDWLEAQAKSTLISK